jgi:phosphatidylinositol alpha-1,6-mannosyltransferase
MTILFITRKFPPSTGGMQNFAYDLYNSLDKEINVELIKWGRSNKYLPLVLPYFFLRASLLLARGDIDIVHSHDGVLAPMAYILSRLFRKPFVVVIHGLDITYKNRLFQMVIPKCVGKASVVFCISQATADEAIKRGVSKSIVRVIPIAVTDKYHGSKELAHKDLRHKYNLDNNTQVLLTVGRLVKRKGVAWFIDNVMPKLVKAHPNTMYLVVGGGEDKTKIEDAISRNSLDDHVKMLGKVDNDTIPLLYNGSDVFVQPNIQVAGDIEGFGLVLLEASICELPVVAANLEGIKDAVTNKENGMLVDSEDAGAFVREISKFLTDNSQAKKFGAHSRQYTLKKYRWDSIAKEYIYNYKAIIKS